MESHSHEFKRNVARALANPALQEALRNARGRFVDHRRDAIAALPEFDALRQAAREIKNHTLENLDGYLIQFEQQVLASGGRVHWARDANEARQTILELCRNIGAERIIKGKSMVGEEIALNQALAGAEFEVIETDLGEYIIQLAGEPPSHIIAPAVHKSRGEIAELFHTHHKIYGLEAPLESVQDIVDEARTVLRQKFLSADVGITGANVLIAESGSIVLVTNEGNGDLTATLPRMHIVIASIEKVVPTLEDAAVILRLLARSATGQAITAYTSFYTGPRREGDLDGPQEFHVVLLDNGRSEWLGNEYREMLRCIRCGACLNHCPVYSSVGGHAYGWVYPGPMGSVLTPLMLGLPAAADLPNASTLCGRCESVCPMSIPLPRLLRAHRSRQFAHGLTGKRERWALGLWGYLARRPALYRPVVAAARLGLKLLGGQRGRITRLPLAGAWLSSRDLPTPSGPSFQRLLRAHREARRQ